jgi:hypothetical protein
MNSDLPSRMSVHLPLSLLAIAAAIFLGAQVGAVHQSNKTMQWQLENLDKQNANLKEAQKQLAAAITARDELVKQSGQVQQQYTAVFTDLLELAKNDADAAKIVNKYKIQLTAPAATAEPAVGTAPPAPAK